MRPQLQSVTAYVIEVTINGDVITVDQDPLKVHQGEKVLWTTKGSETFTIMFKDQGPFWTEVLTFDAATSPQHALNQGHHKYSVVKDSNPTIRLDPMVVVDPPIYP